MKGKIPGMQLLNVSIEHRRNVLPDGLVNIVRIAKVPCIFFEIYYKTLDLYVSSASIRGRELYIIELELTERTVRVQDVIGKYT